LGFGGIGGIIGDESRKSGLMPRQITKWKIAVGIPLLILSPIRFFVKPTTPESIGYDLAGLAWWAFIIWLLWTGFGSSFKKSA